MLGAAKDRRTVSAGELFGLAAEQRRRILAAMLVAIVGGVALLLGTRRAAGAATLDIPWSRLAVTALVAEACIAAARLAWPPMSGRGLEKGLPRQDQFLDWGATAALVLLAIGASFPLARLGDWIVWLPTIAVDQVLRRRHLRRHGNARPPASPAVGFPRSVPTPLPSRSATVYRTALERLRVARARLVPPHRGEGAGVNEGTLLQQLSRVRDEAGDECIHGTLRAEFVAGQRTATLHAAFCPPLARMPDVEAEPGEGPGAQVKIVQAFAHGVRLDVRLAEPAEESCYVVVEVSARPGTIET